MSDQFLGEIRIFPVNAIPRSFRPCDGQLLTISQNTALFSLLDTIYGGDGRVTFGLPNLAGRAMVMAGAGAGLTPYEVGESGGIDYVQLTEKEIPAHTHAVMANLEAKTNVAEGMIWANPGTTRPLPNFYSTNIAKSVNMHEKAITRVGGGNAHNNLMPYLGLVFCIAIEGYFPERG